MAQKTDDEIDKIVDDLVRDEKTAEALKSKLHGAEPMSVKTGVAGESTSARSRYSRADADQADDDLWDNLPV